MIANVMRNIVGNVIGNVIKNILYSKLGHYHYKQYVYNPYNSHITMISNDDMPPSIITQINYFN